MTPACGWLAEAVHAAGGSLKVGAPDEHDRAMAYVQAAAHQALMVFADVVTRSGLDLGDDLWAARTPLFESLFGLATRVLDQRLRARRHRHPVGARRRRDGRARRGVPGSVAICYPRWRPGVVHRGRPPAVQRHAFETVRGTASVAVSAAQSKRTELAHRRRTGELVGLRSLNGSDTLRVGRIVDIGTTEVSFLELLVGEPGRAVLLEGPGAPNARKLGINRRPRLTSFSLGHIEVVIGDELEEQLDRSLAFVHRDVRFLVPESVAGSGVLSVVAPTHGVRDCAVVSEVVRTGQRSVVVRTSIRADNDVEEMVELLARAGAAGLCLVARHLPACGRRGLRRQLPRPSRHFLRGRSPAVDHRRGHRGCGVPGPARHSARCSAAVARRSLAVLPLTSSSSGLVSRSVKALLSCEHALVAGGVADVAVRFDAYVTAGQRLEDLRGRNVYSHPQALAQCSAFIRRWGLVAVPTPSTSEAVAMLASGDGHRAWPSPAAAGRFTTSG